MNLSITHIRDILATEYPMEKSLRVFPLSCTQSGALIDSLFKREYEHGPCQLALTPGQTQLVMLALVDHLWDKIREA